jgi:hypothetical protein
VPAHVPRGIFPPMQLAAKPANLYSTGYTIPPVLKNCGHSLVSCVLLASPTSVLTVGSAVFRWGSARPVRGRCSG